MTNMTKDEAQTILLDRVESWLENEQEWIGAELGRYQQSNPREALAEASDENERVALEQYLETVKAWEIITGKEYVL